MIDYKEEGLQILCEHAQHSRVPLVVQVEDRGEMIVMSPRVLESLLFDRLCTEHYRKIQNSCLL